MRRWLIVITLLGIVPSLLFPIMRALTLGEIVQSADIIVMGKVKDIKSNWGVRSFSKSRIIYTYITIADVEYLNGEGEKELVVCIPGGTVGDTGLGVSDVPTFRLGERVILFLGPSDEQNVREIPELFQGKYTIVNDTIIEKGIPLDNFLQDIKNHLERR